MSFLFGGMAKSDSRGFKFLSLVPCFLLAYLGDEPTQQPHRKPNLASSPSDFLKSSFGNNEVEVLNSASLPCLFLNSLRSQRRRAMSDGCP